LVEAAGVEPGQVLKTRKLVILRTDKKDKKVGSLKLFIVMSATQRRDAKGLFYFQNTSLRKEFESFGLFW